MGGTHRAGSSSDQAGVAAASAGAWRTAMTGTAVVPASASCQQGKQLGCWIPACQDLALCAVRQPSSTTTTEK